MRLESLAKPEEILALAEVACGLLIRDYYAGHGHQRSYLMETTVPALLESRKGPPWEFRMAGLMPSLGLIELPAFKLIDQDGFNWTALRSGDPLGGKQIVLGQLEAAGCELELINLKKGTDEFTYGSVQWRDRQLSKVAVGTNWDSLDPKRHEFWGVTVNYLQEREAACLLIRYLAEAGSTVIVGGSDAYAEPEPYLKAGAEVVVRDKSGAANVALLQSLLGQKDVELSGVRFADGRSFLSRVPPMSPEEWPIPSPELVRQTLGSDYWEAPLPAALRPIGAVMLDLGCDRKCDFCETPTYRVGYQWMSPKRAREWLEAQKHAGARSVIVLSDQFLGRVLWPQGRGEVLEILASARELGLPLLWGNGLEVNKATKGRSLPGGDPAPDLELVEALWGWDGKVGCGQAYIPAERPMDPGAYKKLLPWEHHCEMMRAIVTAGLPDITYGVIVGLPDDDHAGMENLLTAVSGLREELKRINPDLLFRVVPYALRPIPGTPAANRLRSQGLLKFEDPAILGGFWTACSDTDHLSYQEVSDWQYRLSQELSDYEPGFQGITGVTGITVGH